MDRKRLSELGEKGFIARSLEILSNLWVPGPLAPGDDAASQPLGGSYVIFKIDGFSAYSSKYPWNTYSDLGWKAATSCASDVIAKGGFPYIYMISIGASPSLNAEEAFDVILGFKEALTYYGGFFAGGDTNSSKEDLWIDVACIGYTSKEPIPRAGGEGDKIIITGLYGYSGLARIYYENLLKGSIGVEDIPAEVRNATSRPRARIDALKVLEKYRGCIRGSVDVSDSLAESLYLLSEASGRIIEIHEIPIDPRAEEISKELGADPIDIGFNGGEEYELVLAVEDLCANNLVEEMRRTGIIAEIYGEITKERGVGLRYRGRTIPRMGYEHFISI